MPAWRSLQGSLLKLEHRLPYVDSGEPYSARTAVYLTDHWAIDVAQPGRHADDLDYSPSGQAGGDFCVRVSWGNWSRRAVSHDDVFADVARKCRADRAFMRDHFAPALCAVVVAGVDPLQAAKRLPALPASTLPGLPVDCLLAACQLLALCEHRRYGTMEVQGGGRFLPTRFLLGLIEGLWSAHDVRVPQRQGLPGYRALVRRTLGDGRPPQIGEQLARWPTGALTADGSLQLALETV